MLDMALLCLVEKTNLVLALPYRRNINIFEDKLPRISLKDIFIHQMMEFISEMVAK